MLSPWLLLLLALVPVQCFPEGAPNSVCTDMMPKHYGAVPQTSKSPYTLKNSVTKVAPGSTVKVTISGGKFKGFVLQALDATTNKIVGVFTTVPNSAKKIDCDGSMTQNMVTHTSGDQKSSVVLVWKAGAKMALGKKIKFRATVLEDFQTFWTKVESPTVLISK